MVVLLSSSERRWCPVFSSAHIIDTMPLAGARHLRQDGKALRIASLHARRGRISGGCAYHALNGIRIFIIDITPVASRIQRRLFWVVMVLFILFIPSAVIMIRSVLVAGAVLWGSSRGRRTRPTGRKWAHAWLFMRVSGLILVIMVLVHFAIMHVINDIQDISFAFVVKRFATPFWISFDLIMLILDWCMALTECARSSMILWRFRNGGIWLSTLYALGLIFFVVGNVTLVTFRPDAGRQSGVRWGNSVDDLIFITSTWSLLAPVARAQRLPRLLAQPEWWF